MEHGERIPPCVWTAITRTLYHAARSSSTAICPASISGIKISAYFSIISARKPAKALHPSELDVQAETGKRSFSLEGYFFNRQLHFLVAGWRVPAILSNFPSNLIVQTIFYHLKISAGAVDKNQQLLIVLRFLYKGIIIKHNKTEPTYTKTSLFLCEKRRFFMARTEKGVVTTI